MVHLRKTGDGDGKIRVEVDPTHFSKARAEGRHTDDTGAPSRQHPCGGGGERDRHVRYVLRRPPPPPGLLGIQACPHSSVAQTPSQVGGVGATTTESERKSPSSRLELRSLASTARQPEGGPAPLKPAGRFRAQAALLGCRPGVELSLVGVVKV